ncbi:MAG: ATP-grasp enzyme D-alanine-D-alanine ligase [Planctomycetota bacterium]|nr:ATP-grasp enzyme D-alanine-D-alanine ligase [Planctomycetota bacterium]
MLRIGIAYSLKPVDRDDDGPDDRYEEFDKPETIDALAEAIRGDGHDVSLLGDGREFLASMLGNPPDFVFNFAEGQGIGRDREARIPAVCEMLGVPYSGSDPLTMAAALDKTMAKRLIRDSVLTPDEAVIPVGWPDDQIRTALEVAFPQFPTVIAKPIFEGSSKGIRGKSLADSVDEAVELCTRLSRIYCQPILVEEFIGGDEVTVGVIGNGRSVRVLGTMRIIPVEPTERFVYSLEMKRDWRRCIRYEVPAIVDEQEPGLLALAATNAYEALGCRDVARIDFRIDRGIPYFIEANPLPGLAPVSSDLVILAQGYGIGHTELVQRILRTALDRVGLAGKRAETQ